jgi:hypothetical protein
MVEQAETQLRVVVPFEEEGLMMDNYFLPKHVALFFLSIMMCWLVTTFIESY